MTVKRRRATLGSRRAAAGFTLFEALVSVALMGAIVVSLGAVTGQWLPNWSRGLARVQRLETLDLGLQRLAADLEAAEFVTANAASKTPFFEGDPKSVTFVRVAAAPGTALHLEFVRLAEIVDQRGFALVRSHAPFKPLDPKRPNDTQLYFTDPVALVRAPFRLSFAFAGADRLWQDSWKDAYLLPSAVRLQVRAAATDRVLVVSTATLVNSNLPAECVTHKSVQECFESLQKPETAEQSKPASGNGP